MPSAVRPASSDDLEAIRRIYNEGIEDRVATLDREPKSAEQIAQLVVDEHDERYAVLVATESGDDIRLGLAESRFRQRCAHRRTSPIFRSMWAAILAAEASDARLANALRESAEAAAFIRSCSMRSIATRPEKRSIADADSSKSASSKSTD